MKYRYVFEEDKKECPNCHEKELVGKHCWECGYPENVKKPKYSLVQRIKKLIKGGDDEGYF
jgi:hypothetical protein